MIELRLSGKLRPSGTIDPATESWLTNGGAVERRVYRGPFLSIALGWVPCALFFVVGLSSVTIGPSQHGGPAATILGTLTLLLSLWLAAVLATNRLIVTSGGVTNWYYLRRRFIGWVDIRNFSVGPSRSRMAWPSVIIELNDGTVIVTNVASWTSRYPARIAGELRSLQRAVTPLG